MCWNSFIPREKQSKPNTSFTTYTKISSGLIIVLNVKLKILKLSKGNVIEYFDDHGIGHDFLKKIYSMHLIKKKNGSSHRGSVVNEPD